MYIEFLFTFEASFPQRALEWGGGIVENVNSLNIYCAFIAKSGADPDKKIEIP